MGSKEETTTGLVACIEGRTHFRSIYSTTSIYRVGILMYGKRPTLPEMLRWLKYS